MDAEAADFMDGDSQGTNTPFRSSLLPHEDAAFLPLALVSWEDPKSAVCERLLQLLN